jgi:hypothetical protein
MTKAKPKKPKRLSYSKHVNKAKELHRQSVTTRYADEYGYCRCITCGNRWLHYLKEMHAGHYIHGRNNVYFNVLDCFPQCHRCNYYGKGMGREYGLVLVEWYGADVVRWLHDQAKIPKQFTRGELDEIIENRRAIIRLYGAKPCR